MVKAIDLFYYLLIEESMSNRKRLIWFLVKAGDRLLETDEMKRLEEAYIEYGSRNMPKRPYLDKSKKDVDSITEKS